MTATREVTVYVPGHRDDVVVRSDGTASVPALHRHTPDGRHLVELPGGDVRIWIDWRLPKKLRAAPTVQVAAALLREWGDDDAADGLLDGTLSVADVLARPDLVPYRVLVGEGAVDLGRLVAGLLAEVDAEDLAHEEQPGV